MSITFQNYRLSWLLNNHALLLGSGFFVGYGVSSVVMPNVSLGGNGFWILLFVVSMTANCNL